MVIAHTLQLRQPTRPGDAESLRRRGAALQQRGELAAALDAYQAAVVLTPDHVETLTGLAAVLTALQRHGEALPVREQLVRLQPDLENVLSLGTALIESGRPGEALRLLSEAGRLHHDQGRLVHLTGLALFRLELLAPAIGAFYYALELSPGHAAIHAHLAAALLADGQPTEAARHGREAFRIAPTAAHSTTLSCILIDQGQLEEALAVANTGVLTGKPGLEVLINRSIALESLGHIPQAVQAARAALAVARTAATEHHLGALLLTQGQLTEEAWELYEARLRLRGTRKWLAGELQWNGEDVRGQTVLLHAEQGLGDTLQFVRYIPLVAARGARVILVVQPALKRLLANAPGAAQVLAVGEALPAFDKFSLLLSLPKIFRTTLATIPPSLSYHPDLSYDGAFEPWTDSAAGLRVGLVWAGNAGFVFDRHRSVVPADLAVLAGVPGVQFYSLQQHKGLPVALPPELGAVDLMLGVDDFTETAALVAGLDLVISVDTAVAHLAATMGKPVWLLSRLRGCWRWLNDRTDSPWYPSVRVVRQQQPNHWGAVLQGIRQDLMELASRPVIRSPGRVRRPEGPGHRPCKICDTPSPAIGIVDFSKSCEDRRKAPLPRSGQPVAYHRCPHCALVFTGDFDAWSRADFGREIYNAGYVDADPDFASERPASSAALIGSLFGEACRGMKVLDYGGGEGALAALLSRNHGMVATTYDPFNPACDLLPARRFPLVTCFEVLEHTLDPRATIRAIASLVQEDGVVLFSTLVQPAEFAAMGVNWWYVAPRNGHITIFSVQALKALWSEVGFEMISHNQDLHMAARTLPPVAKRFASAQWA